MKKILFLLLTLLASVNMYAQTVAYIDVNGETKTLSSLKYTAITDQTELTDGWYVVNRDVTINERITINGKVNLILSDGKTLTVPKGIALMDANELHIYGQKGGTGNLIAGPSDAGNAGIGGNLHWDCGTLEVNGGNVTATAGEHAAGIGGGAQGNWAGTYGSGGNVTINGGSVTATGSDYGAAIGGGGNHTTIASAIPGGGGNLVIKGGKVKATGTNTSYSIGPGRSKSEGVEGAYGKLRLSWTNPSDRIYMLSVYAEVFFDSQFVNAETQEEITKPEQIAGVTIAPKLDNNIVISYIDADGKEQKLAAGTYTMLTNQTELSGDNVWYVVNRDVTISDRIYVFGKVHLVLLDECTLTAPRGLRVYASDELNIYGQSGCTGALNAGPAADYEAGIGGNIHDDSGRIVINGGVITAKAGYCAAGIGGGAQGYWAGNYGNNGTVIINGGVVTAIGNNYGSGIGGGGNHKTSSKAIPGSGGTVIINGGDVTACGGLSDDGVMRSFSIGPGRGPLGSPDGEVGTLQLGWRNPTDHIYVPYGVQAKVTLNSPFIYAEDKEDVSENDHLVDYLFIKLIDILPKIENNVDVAYIDADGKNQTLSKGSYTLISNQEELTSGWYVVDQDMTLSSRVNINGTVHLVLTDGHTLTASKGIRLTEGNELDIYGQTLGTGTLRSVTDGSWQSGIGGNAHETGGKLIVNGGDVTATGGSSASGIGGGGNDWRGCWGDGGTFIQNGGTVKANGNGYGAGIGGGGYFQSGAGVSGGNGGTAIINGGYLSATSPNGYGIGSGSTPDRQEGNPTTLQLSWRNLTDEFFISSDKADVTLKKDFLSADTHEPVRADSISGFIMIPDENNRDDIAYIDATGEEQTISGGSYTTLYDQSDLTEGWYVLKRDQTIDPRLSISGKVHLVLTDGATLTAPQGIKLEDDNELHIYGQSEGTGALTAGPASDFNSGIGGNIHWGCGILEINGGNITATAGYSAAGIGGGAQGNWAGYYGDGGTVTINGGVVKATGNLYGAGIGGGGNHRTATSAISGNGGILKINGGSVTAIGGEAGGYGVGPGTSASNVEGDPGTLELSWRNTTDSIYMQSVKANASISRTFAYKGTTELAKADSLDGLTIVPARAVFIDDLIENGTVTADKEIFTFESDEEQNVTLTVTPSEGYLTRNILIKTPDDQDVEKELVNESTYTFVMPANDVYIGAEFVLFIKGDVNFDGNVDISDVVSIINCIAGNPTYNNSADVNEDGAIDISDIVAVINIIAGI